MKTEAPLYCVLIANGPFSGLGWGRPQEGLSEELQIESWSFKSVVKFVASYAWSFKSVVKCEGPYPWSFKRVVKCLGPYPWSFKTASKIVGFAIPGASKVS